MKVLNTGILLLEESSSSRKVGRQDQIYRRQTYLLWKKEEWIYILGKKQIRLKKLGKESRLKKASQSIDILARKNYVKRGKWGQQKEDIKSHT